MERHEISGDWVVPTQTQMKELVDVIGELPLPIIDRLLREPAVRSLNFDMHYPSGGRNVCSLQIVDSPINGDKIAFDEGTQSAVYLRLFTVEGRAAELEFTAYLWFSGENLHYSIGRPEGREESDEFAETLTLQYFTAFIVTQFMMLHSAEKIPHRKEYRKELRPAKESLLTAPYTQPGKVRVLDISAAVKKVGECVRKESAIHIWHCQAWGVRGHYRHYKTGKVSYVKPYVKGKNKAAYEGREYALPSGRIITEELI